MTDRCASQHSMSRAEESKNIESERARECQLWTRRISPELCTAAKCRTSIRDIAATIVPVAFSFGLADAGIGAASMARRRSWTSEREIPCTVFVATWLF
mmetsp:Transcript_3810/g.8901  ORF Transcript_3810/g.8901 Transcript_3810/m.8901 type:complete len:99 (+) Transcript_3810:678-974(+)